MTDATDTFAEHGAPTVQQVRTVWDSLPHATCRKVADILHRRGFSISYRTVARYQSSGWAEPMANPVKRKRPEDVGSSQNEAIAAAVIEEIVQQVEAEAAADGEAPPPPANEPGAQADPREVANHNRFAALMKKGENELRKMESKTRVAINVMLMEAMARKAHVMALAPKEMASFTAAMTESMKAPVATGKAPGLPGDDANDVTPLDNPRVIEGTVNPPNPVADTIASFRRKIRG